MSIQDKSVVRSAAELEKKYNLAKLLGMAKNVEVNKDSLIKIENELNNMLKSLIINLGDVLDSQSDISLWFYPGTPTTNNAPYTSWSNKSEHIGDIYYDTKTGYVYQYKEVNGVGLWEVNTNPDLIEAMAITNSESDTSTDHERKVFFKTPTIPYSNGDWWVKEDGSLYMCQITKNSGAFEENDFVNSSNYTDSIAEKIGDEIKVLKGTISLISDSYAKFTDLATGGSTTIAGDNITTGAIKSKNYVSKTSGMKIDLDKGILDSKNLQLDANGDLNITGYITTNKGILSNFQYFARGNTGNDFGNYNMLGVNVLFYEGEIEYQYADLEIDAYIPSGFTVVSAELVVNHSVVGWFDDNGIGAKGYARNIKVYKAAAGLNTSFDMGYKSDYYFYPIATSQLTPIGDIGTPSVTDVGGRVETLKKIDIKNHLTEGNNKIIIRTGDTLTNSNSTRNACLMTGLANATLNVIGYMKV